MEQSKDYKSNQSDLPLDSFNILSQCSLSSLVSGDESFVVLWKDGDNKSVKEADLKPTNNELEARSLPIKSPPMEIEDLSFLRETLEEENLFGSVGKQTERKIIDDEKMVQSTCIPQMPLTDNGLDSSTVISIPILNNDLTSEEVEKKVSEIIEENVRLKDTILGNNKTMKSQYERIVVWQKDVQNVLEAHKQKIIEAKQFIERLKRENGNLSRELEHVKTIYNSQEEEIFSLKETLKEKEQCSQEKLHPTSENNTEVELAQNLTVADASVIEYKAKLDCANSKVEMNEKEIDNLQRALRSSKKELEEMPMVSREKRTTLRMILIDVNFKAQVELKKMQDLYKEKLEFFTETIHSLSSKLFATGQQQEIANIKGQLESAEVILNEVEESRKDAYAQIDSLNTEIWELKKKTEGSEAQANEIIMLRAQLDLYKTDFKAEKSANEAIKVEKENLLEDLRKLHACNRELRSKIDSIHKNYYVVPRNQEGQAGPLKPSPDDCFVQ